MESEHPLTATRARSERQHLPGLDGVRGLAILAVMCFHLMPPNYPMGAPGGMMGVAIMGLHRFFDAGWWGVDLFFALSGFLITGILLEAKGAAHYFGHFYARRSLRIFPLYYGVLALMFLVLPWLAAHATTTGLVQRLGVSQANAPLQAWLWLYVVNFKIAISGWIFGSLNHFWSLAVEEHFYLVWPAVVVCCSTRNLARLCLAVAAASLLCRAALLVGGLERGYIYVLSPCRFDGLALGGFVAALLRLWKTEMPPAPNEPTSSKPGIWASIRLLLGIQPPAGGSPALLHAAFSRIFVLLLPMTVLALLFCYRWSAFMVIAGHTLFAATFAAALPGAALAQQSSALSRGGWLCLAPLQVLGKYSYGLYVTHPFILRPLESLLMTPFVQNHLGKSYLLTCILRLALGLPVSLIIAWFTWHGFEKHFLRLKRFFPTDTRAKPAHNESEPRVPAVYLPAE